jgi:hypothetical protein
MPSLSDCFPFGSVNLGKYVVYSTALRQRARWHTSLAMTLGELGTSSFLMDNMADVSRVKRTQMQLYVYAHRGSVDGPLEIIPPKESMWYCFYVCNFHIDKDVKLQKAFQNQFCLPYQQYLELVEMVCKDKLFVRWCGYKKSNKMVLPVELLVLGLFCYLSHGWTFNDCKESTAIDKDVHRMFFCVFILFGSTILYKKWVSTPINLLEAKSNMHEYSKAGFPGCIGPSDCTNIITDCCE